MAEQEQSEYYQAIAREFLRRRGAPFFLSARDVAVVASWEKQRIPLHVVLEGIGWAFDGLRTRSRGTKGISLFFCDVQVQKAMAQHADRGAGRKKAAAPRSVKVDRARHEAERCLRNLPVGEVELRSLFESASGLLAGPAPTEELLEKIDVAVDEILWRRASRDEREEAARRLAAEFPGQSREEIRAGVRTCLIKAARRKLQIPYVSLFYY
jgi:hypothetical protein